jgi:hypothetical protein
MEAAEGIFGGEFDNVPDDNADIQMASPNERTGNTAATRITVQ